MLYERDVLLKDLHENIIKVTFTKVNGEKRTMKCTLKGEHLPPNANQAHLAEEHRKPENKDVIACWDVENNGWRSFRMDSVEYVESADY